MMIDKVFKYHKSRTIYDTGSLILTLLRGDHWSIIFNEESDEPEEANENDLLMMINEVCSS